MSMFVKGRKDKMAEATGTNGISDSLLKHVTSTFYAPGRAGRRAKPKGRSPLRPRPVPWGESRPGDPGDAADGYLLG